jgi:hypothetical protein
MLLRKYNNFTTKYCKFVIASTSIGGFYGGFQHQNIKDSCEYMFKGFMLSSTLPLLFSTYLGIWIGTIRKNYNNKSNRIDIKDF